MGYSVLIPNGIVTMAHVDFKCPKCNHLHTYDFYYKELTKDKWREGFIYKKCKGCRSILGITSDMMGDVQVWLKTL